MNKTIVKELIALLLIVLAVLFFYASLAPMAYIVCYIVVVLMFLVFIFGIIKSKDGDEREAQHRVMAADTGFIAGGVTVLIAIAYQTFNGHSVDPWMFLILVVMLATRLAVRIYLNSKN